ncbi:ATP-binding cassette domain-containing protein [Aeromicrobium sp. UC242_57]|uniref:ATP-binding cassette domain-containing protein n=1 Tax=Aeromicrobium sp. UC242_57 TaxID=3374624 RepID=UPI0037914508
MTTHIALPARARAQLTAEQISILRGGRPVLTSVDLAVGPRIRVGVVGENGRGKSTLLHILAGVLEPDDGTVHRTGTLGLAEQEMAVRADATVGDAIDVELADARSALRALDDATQALAVGAPGSDDAYAAALDAAESLGAWDADRRVDIALENLGAITDRSRRLDELSVGQRYRVRLGCLLGAEYDFLLFDEPTNHLDAAGLDFLTRRLQDHPGGAVVVSHDRALLTDAATLILDLDPSRDGLPRTYGNGFQGYREGREAELSRWETEFDHQRSEHARLTQNLSEAQNRLTTGWRPDKGTGKHQRATRAPALVRSVHRRRDDLEKHAVTAPVPPLRLTMPDLPVRSGTLLVADEVRVDDRMQRSVTVTLDSRSRLVITGENGSGKSTLLAVLAGQISPDRGSVRTSRNVRVGLLRQESTGHRDRTVRADFTAHVQELARRDGPSNDEVPSLTSMGLVSSADLNRRMRDLSMGQQRRLDLAKVIAARPHILLLDEPTNHLSIALVDELTEALEVTLAAVVIATHDRQLRRDVSHWEQLALDLTC